MSEERQRGPGAPGRKILESLPTQSRTTGQQAAARSRMVRRLRIALPVLALVLVAAFVFNTRSRPVDDAFLSDFEQVSALTDDLEMANPHFSGIDENGKPFEITANAAIQNTEQKDIVELEKPRAVQGEQSEQSIVTADKGVYRSEENILELTDGVTLEHDIGNDTYVFRAPSATVSIKDETVVSETGVGGEGSDGGALRADRMRAYNAENRVVIEGNVSMRIYPKSAKPLDNQMAPKLENVELKDPQ